MSITTEFPEDFVDKVHDYLKRNQQQYRGKYQNHFIIPLPKKNTGFFASPKDTPYSFQSICCIAGKMCGILSLTYSNDTLAILLDAVKNAYRKSSMEEQKIIQELFANKPIENITEDDLLEIGLYEKVDKQPKTPGELLLRHENLKTIYAGEHQRRNRQGGSLPEHIHHWVTIQQLTPKLTEEFLFQSELHTVKYEVKTAKSNDHGKIWLITESKKEPISTPENKNADSYFLTQLEKTLRVYFDSRDNIFYRTFGKKSESSSKLYNELYDTIIDPDKNDAQKVNAIISALNEALKRTGLCASEQALKPRRLINILTEAGFMSPDILRCARNAEHPLNASTQSDLTETQDEHQMMHR